ncbi:hypothetical protein ABTD45_19370, partial [Acinetobacter baumannii]
HGLSVENSSIAYLQPIMTLYDVVNLATKLEKEAKVGNKHYTLSHNSDTSLNPIGVSEGEVGSCGKKTHLETKPTPMDVNMKKQCFD